MRKKLREPDAKQATLTTKSRQYAEEHNDKIARVEEMARQWVETEPEFVLRVLDNIALTKIVMALEARTSQQLKRIEMLEKVGRNGA